MPVYDTIITGSHVILPRAVTDKNILINDGIIAGITSGIPEHDTKIDGSGLVCIPGAIDTHVHYGVYSPINEAARTESHAAAIGGITTMMRMLRLEGPFSGLLQAQLDAASKNHYIDYAIHASVFNTRQVQEMELCVKKSVTSFKIYMNLGGEVGHVYMDMPPGSPNLVPARVNVTDDMVRHIVREAARLGCPVLVHAEDYETCGCGMKTAKKENRDGLDAWSESRPPKSEAKAIRTVSKFGREYDCTIYFVHIGSKEALDQIRQERRLGTRIFVETCPHYLALSHEDQEGYLAKVMPPIRTRGDGRAVWEALAGGAIDTIGTDHVANQLALKLGIGGKCNDGAKGDTNNGGIKDGIKDVPNNQTDDQDSNAGKGRPHHNNGNVWQALAGFPGIGTMLPILFDRGIRSGKLTLEQLVRVTSSNAARIFGMYPQKGTLEIGSDADITMIDPKLDKKVTADLFGGFSDYSVYKGMALRGWPVRTIVRGSTIAGDFKVVSSPGYGSLVRRRPSSKHTLDSDDGA